MKKYLSMMIPMCAWLLAACLFLSPYAYADPPQDVVLSYNIQAQTLTVTITHPSSFTGLHYIKQVKIMKNNEWTEKNDYKSQASKTTFVYTYGVPATANDLLEVTATCNLLGKKTATLKVEQQIN